MPAPTTQPTKAVIAAVVAALASFVASVQGRAEMHTIDWLIVVLSAAVAGLTVYVAPNKPRA